MARVITFRRRGIIRCGIAQPHWSQQGSQHMSRQGSQGVQTIGHWKSYMHGSKVMQVPRKGPPQQPLNPRIRMAIADRQIAVERGFFMISHEDWSQEEGPARSAGVPSGPVNWGGECRGTAPFSYIDIALGGLEKLFGFFRFRGRRRINDGKQAVSAAISFIIQLGRPPGRYQETASFTDERLSHRQQTARDLQIGRLVQLAQIPAAGRETRDG